MDETTQSVAATEDVKDDLLSKAAANAVEGEEIVEEIKEVEEKIEALDEKEDKDGLPADQKERSQLGRTIAALHRRLDDFDQRDSDRGYQIDKLISAMQPKVEEAEEDDDMPLTRAEARRIAREEARLEKEAEIAQTENLSKKYHKDYALTWAAQAKGLTNEEYSAIIAEAEETKYDPSDNGVVDAKLMFKEVQLRLLKKQVGVRVNPLENNQPKNGIGTVTTQKVPDRETVLPKLDAPAQSYLNYISQEDGAEKATKLHKSLA